MAQTTVANSVRAGATRHPFPVYGWLGVAGIVGGMGLIFSHWRPLSDYWFAAVWFGYILLADAAIAQRDGQSLIRSRARDFALMLPLSAAGWWFFEGANLFVNNWHYVQPYDIPQWWKQVWSAIFFSTVVPAEFLTALLLWPYGLVQRRAGGQPRVTSPLTARLLPLLGLGSLLLAVFYPLYAYPLIWGFMALILDPLNYRAGRPSILGYLARGDWRVPTALALGGTLCGFLWEAWNYWAFPKWMYTVPWVSFLHIFEMPLLGYLGYWAFAWEVFALFHFVRGRLPGAPPPVSAAQQAAAGPGAGLTGLGL